MTLRDDRNVKETSRTGGIGIRGGVYVIRGDLYIPVQIRTPDVTLSDHGIEQNLNS